MAPQPNHAADAPLQSNFAASLLKLGTTFNLHQVFDDFLTVSIAAYTQNIVTKRSYYEDEYLQVSAKYKNSELRHEFPKAFTHLIEEMEERLESKDGNDVLGEFFEQHITYGRNGQFFTPFAMCETVALLTITEAILDNPEKRSLSIYDPTCGSGRMLLAAHKILRQGHVYYGMDSDLLCVKMTALNLFLNGMWNSQVICVNTLSLKNFSSAYKISYAPLGIFKITDEESILWNMIKNSFNSETKHGGQEIFVTLTPPNEKPGNSATQLDLF